MIITPASLNVFFTGLSTQFTSLYETTPVFWNKLATLYPMASEQETIGWMGKIPTFRQWIGSRAAHDAAAEGYSVKWLPWELTMSVDKFKISDDQYGVYSSIVKQMGMQAAKWPDYLMVNALQNGGDSVLGLCPDGLSFWNASHRNDIYAGGPTGTTTYSNTYTSTLTAATYETVKQAMRVRIGQDGKPLGLGQKLLLVVPPELELEAKTILFSDYYAIQGVANETMVGTTQNQQKGTADLLVLPELSAGSNEVGLNSKTWYLLETGFSLQPFLFMLREAPTFAYRMSPTDPVVFDKHQFLFGGEARGNYGYALPFLASRSVGS